MKYIDALQGKHCYSKVMLNIIRCNITINLDVTFAYISIYNSPRPWIEIQNGWVENRTVLYKFIGALEVVYSKYKFISWLPTMIYVNVMSIMWKNCSIRIGETVRQ